MTTLLSMVLTLAFKINTKSTVDIETDEVQGETDSDTEIEYNQNEENEPEYDVVDGEMDSEL